MKKGGGFLKLSSVILFFVTIAACGTGGGGNSSSEKSSSTKSPEKTTKQKYHASFNATVDIESGTVTFVYNDGKTKRRAARKNVESDAALVSELLDWDPIKKIVSGKVRITNKSLETFYATHVVITSVTGGASVYNENGYDPDGKPYFDHAPGGEKILPSMSGSSVEWKFADPMAVSFNFSGKIYADNWHQIAGPGVSFGWDNATAEDATDTIDNSFIPSLEALNGKIYTIVGKQDHSNRNEAGNPRSGAEVWEYDPTSGSFTQVNSDGWGGSEASYNKIYYDWGGVQTVYNGKLYNGTGKSNFLGGQETPINNGGEVWRFDPSANPKWTMVWQDTDADGIYSIFSFDGSIFAGTCQTGYGRSYKGSKLDADLAWSSTGNSGSWVFVMTDGFGDVDQYGNPTGTALLQGGSGTIGGSIHGYVGKGSISSKPGVVLYIADTKNGGGGGRLKSDWTKAIDFTSDDITKTISSVTAGASGSSEYRCVISGGGLIPHVYAHHLAYVKHGGIEYTGVIVMDNNATDVIIGVSNSVFTPVAGDVIRLGSGANERGWGETGNMTASHFVNFSPSSEGSPGTTNQLWVFTSNLPMGVAPYINAGGEIFTLTNLQYNNTAADNDIIRRVDSFTANTDIGYPTPSTSGGANKGGTVISPNSAFAGFDTGIDPTDPLDIFGRDDFTFYPGSHEGWIYVAVQPFLRVATGCRIYKTADGINWITVTTDSFGDDQLIFRTFKSSAGKLYAGGSRQIFDDSVSSHPTSRSLGSITASTANFYEGSYLYPSPTISYPESGTLLLEARRPTSEPVLPSYIYYEKIQYTSNRIATSATLNMTLPSNNGYLGKPLWATDTEVVLNDIPGNLGLDPSRGAVCIEGEIINYNSVSGSTLINLTRGIYSPDFTGVLNHYKGSPAFRSTRLGLTETDRLDGNGTVYSIAIGGNPTQISSRKNDAETLILVDNEEIKYTQRTDASGTVKDDSTGTQLRTLIRGCNSTKWSAHSPGTVIYKPGFAGLTRGALGTTATNWGAGEDALLISVPPSELWATD
ncbi:MAG: hypothetical protein HZA77_15500 [Candidatus Schekmanbacteria bacterium]|nr:hypothetical protein [Candidatus Schekmanbacteria bacterium]